MNLAGKAGIEPTYWGPKSHVLPLDDFPMKNKMAQEVGFEPTITVLETVALDQAKLHPHDLIYMWPPKPARVMNPKVAIYPAIILIRFLFGCATYRIWRIGWDSNPRCFVSGLKARAVRHYGNRSKLVMEWWKRKVSILLPLSYQDSASPLGLASLNLVSQTGFEPVTPSPQTRCADLTALLRDS